MDPSREKIAAAVTDLPLSAIIRHQSLLSANYALEAVERRWLLRIDQAEEDAAVGGGYGGRHLIGGGGPGHGRPVCSHSCARGIRLGFQRPAGMIGVARGGHVLSQAMC